MKVKHVNTLWIVVFTRLVDKGHVERSIDKFIENSSILKNTLLGLKKSFSISKFSMNNKTSI